MPKVLDLCGVEEVEERPCLGGVRSEACQVLDPLLLLDNMPLALGNMPFSFFQMTELHCAVHRAVYHLSALEEGLLEAGLLQQLHALCGVRNDAPRRRLLR